MRLTAPSLMTVLVAVLLAVAAVAAALHLAIVPVVSDYPFTTLLVAFVLLLAGNLVRGL